MYLDFFFLFNLHSYLEKKKIQKFILAPHFSLRLSHEINSPLPLPPLSPFFTIRENKNKQINQKKNKNRDNFFN